METEIILKNILNELDNIQSPQKKIDDHFLRGVDACKDIIFKIAKENNIKIDSY